MRVLDDVRLALRGLLRQPAFLVVALLTLGIAIGANIAVFSLVNATMLRPLPFGDRSERVVSVHASHSSEAEDWEDARLSYVDLQDLRAAEAIEDAGGFVERNFTLQEGEAERVLGGSVTPNLFPLLGAEPVLGRQFREDEAAPSPVSNRPSSSRTASGSGGSAAALVSSGARCRSTDAA